MRKTEKSILQHQVFWRILLEFEEQILQIHKHSWLSITWTLKQLNSIQTFVEDIPEVKLSLVPSEQNLQQCIFGNSNSHCLELFLCFILILTLSPSQIFSYWESTVAPFISSYSHSYLESFIFLLLVCWYYDRNNTDLILKSIHSQDFQHKTICRNFWCAVEQKAVIFLQFCSNLE